MSDSPSSRTKVKRLPERGAYDTELIHSILDESLICHVGFNTDSGPVVIPTIHARVGNTLYLHGSPASRMLRSTPGQEICVTVTIVDGIVAARSAFHHSMNYRSVVVFGVPRVVDDVEERAIGFEAVTEHVIPGRWDEARRPNDKEDRGTKLLALELDEASAKTRSGPPGDDDDDMELDIWAGVIPIAVTAGDPIPAPDLKAGVEMGPSIRGYSKE
ncbi:MAG: pyridoxamine 5'-phosphate oxidase family protein [Actinomycetota bacterium]|nr:pyridoxamine 5'-phosphate oxidase family protein [Actinomycetota bacterium]